MNQSKPTDSRVLELQLRLTQLDIPVETVQKLEPLLALLTRKTREMPVVISHRSRVEKAVLRWQTKHRWLELRLVVGDFSTETHLVAANFNRMAFRTYINGITERDIDSAFDFLYGRGEPVLSGTGIF